MAKHTDLPDNDEDGDIGDDYHRDKNRLSLTFWVLFRLEPPLRRPGLFDFGFFEACCFPEYLNYHW